MKIVIITLLLGLAVLAGGGCGNAVDKPVNAVVNSNGNTAAANQTSETATAAADSPTATMKNFIEALREKDVEGIKKACSRASLKSFEEAAEAKNLTLEEYITRGRELTGEKMPEMRNETIQGETATLEVLDPDGKDWETVPFIREDGGWKIAFDKMK